MVAWLVFACWLKMETLMLLTELLMVLLTEFDSDEMLHNDFEIFILNHWPRALGPKSQVSRVSQGGPLEKWAPQGNISGH